MTSTATGCAPQPEPCGTAALAGVVGGHDSGHDAQFGAIDLPPASRTNVVFVKSVTMENDGHEEEQIYRRTDHWVLAASRSRHADQGVVTQRRF